MRIEVTPDAASVAMAAADVICDVARTRHGAAIALPTGGTPILAYRELERRERGGAVSFEGARVYAIDEFVGPAPGAPGTNGSFYRQHLTVHLAALICPDSAAPDPHDHIRSFAESILEAGGLDLCVLGIGMNGHIAFNEPGSALESGPRVVDLEETSRQAHADAFGGIERVPKRGMTLGVADLLRARRILVLAQGSLKAAVVRAVIEDQPDASLPASWLQSHHDITWLVDVDAAAELQLDERGSRP